MRELGYCSRQRAGRGTPAPVTPRVALQQLLALRPQTPPRGCPGLAVRCVVDDEDLAVLSGDRSSQPDAPASHGIRNVWPSPSRSYIPSSIITSQTRTEALIWPFSRDRQVAAGRSAQQAATRWWRGLST